MNLNLIFLKNGEVTNLMRLLHKNNPFDSIETLCDKAQLSKTDQEAFLRNNDNISVYNLNHILALCSFDIKQTALIGLDEMEEIEIAEDENEEEED